MSEIRELIAEKDRIEKEIAEAHAYLSAQPCGVTGSLHDSEGFPREDCEAYSIVDARQVIARGKNDLKEVMGKIYERLQK